MKKLLTLIITLVFLTSVVCTGTTSFADIIGSGAQSVSGTEDVTLIDSLHSSEDGSRSNFAFDGDEIHTQNGACVTVEKHSGNTENNGYISKYDGTKLTYHGANDSATNSNSIMKIVFDSGDTDVSDALEKLEFVINTNVPGRTYASVHNAETSLGVLCWANSNLTANTNHVVKVEIDRRAGAVSADGKATAKVYVDGNIISTKTVSEEEYGINLQLAAYKTPTVTVSGVKYGYEKTVYYPANNFTEYGKELINKVHASSNGSESGFAFDGDEVYTQNGATLTVVRDSSNDGAGFVHQYDGSKLTYHGKDSAHNGNSGVSIVFGEGENDISESLEYAEFSIMTNAPSRTYATLKYGGTAVSTLCWANSELASGTKYLIRVEIDRRNPVDGKATVKVYKNGTLLNTSNVDDGSRGLYLWLAAYRTPTITISDVKYGFERSLIAMDSWINTLHEGTDSNGTKITYTGDELHSQNGSTLTISNDNSNTGNGFAVKYAGEKLTYHGANDNATNGNSGVSFIFASGENEVVNNIECLEFAIKTNAPGRTYAHLYLGSKTLCIIANGGSELESGVNHKIRVEIDRRNGAANSPYVAKALVYKDSELVSRVDIDESVNNGNLSLWLAAYKTPTITISEVNYGIVEFKGNIGSIEIDSSNSVAKVKVLNPVINYVGQYGNYLNLFVAGYDDNNKLISLTPINETRVVGEGVIETEFTVEDGVTVTKAFLWDMASGMKPLCVAVSH